MKWLVFICAARRRLFGRSQGGLLCGLFLISQAVLALEPGKNYDFFQKNGQNVLGAELVSESETGYTVRLKYVPKLITLARANLLRHPELSVVQAEAPPQKKSLVFQPNFALHGSLGFSYLTFGPIAYIFRTGYEARLGGDWQFFREPFYRVRALTFVSTLANYQASPRRMRLISAHLGPKILAWDIPKYQAAVFVSALIGVTYADLLGYTFQSQYATLSTRFVFSLEKRWEKIALAFEFYGNSLFDRDLIFSSTGVSLAARYGLWQASPF
jgi:hypothetical protein